VTAAGNPVSCRMAATLYVGSPKSAVMLRVYDKEAESGQAGAGVRWEVQARGKQARELAREQWRLGKRWPAMPWASSAA